MAVELPEAITLAKQMNEVLPGKVIQRVHLNEKSVWLINQGFINLHEVDLKYRLIQSVSARGKWVLIYLSANMILEFALETGGKLLYTPPGGELPLPFHVRLALSDGSYLTQQIVGVGWARALSEMEFEVDSLPSQLGVSPLDEDQFTLENFARMLELGQRRKIKRVLLEQDLIAGIGDGYVGDILLKAGVRPNKKAGEIEEGQRLALYQAIKEVLKEAVRQGGSQSEFDLYNRRGKYKQLVGQHASGKPCPVCGTPIEETKVLGSEAYLCPVCQK
jgi:formamidopyrimidine-DNA glycosylase